MKKRILAMTCCLALLLGCLAGLGIISAAEGTEGDNEVTLYFPENDIDEEQEIFLVEGGQIRTSGKALPAGSGKTALRLASTLACEGVVVNDYVGDYSKAMITWCDVSYPIEEVGTLVAKESDITKNDLTPEEALKYDVTPTAGGVIVPAKKVYSQAADGKSITFTAVITNVPYHMYGADICARAYVRYTTADGTKTLYGDVMTRNVYDVWADTEDTSREVLDRAEYLQDGTGYFEKNARVVFLGDSITNDGKFISGIFRYYAAKYPQDKVEMYMAGVKGGNAGGGLTYLEDQVLSLNPDYVSIMFGMNDIYRSLYTNGYQGTAEQVAKIDAYEANMENIVKTLRAKGVKVILCTPSPYDQTCTAGATNYPGCADALQECAKRVKTLAEKYTCKVVDFNGPMTEALAYVQDETNGGSTDLTIIDSTSKDRVHPGTLGHDLMARIFLRDIGEDADIVPTNQYLLKCLKGEASVYTKFGDLDISPEFAAKVGSISTTHITGSDNRAVCSYWEGEFTFVGTSNYKTLTLQQKIDKVATFAGQYPKDWRGTECIPKFEANAKALGSNRAKVIEAVKKVYATE